MYNPFSGENKIISSLDFIIASYQKCGYQIEPYRITHESNFDDCLGKLDESYQHILVAGGDGTVNSVVNEMKFRNIDIPIAVLPAGTANDFANILGFQSTINNACKDILAGEVSQVDLGVVNGKYFVNVLSAGLFTEISQKTPTKFKNTFGKLAYYVSTIGELPNFRKIHLRIDSRDIVYDDNSMIIFVFNGRTAGNFDIAHHANLHDGLLDILVVKGDNVVETISTAFHFLTQLSSQYPRGVVHFKSSSLRISSDDEISVDIDGEAGPKLPLEVKCIEKGLKVIVPKNYKNGK